MFKLIILLVFWSNIFTYYVVFGNVKSAKVEDRKNIVGGEFVPLPNPYVHQISLRSGIYHICGGSIIDDRRILTAAHCVYKKTTSELYVIAGIRNVTDTGTRYEIKQIYVHENYSSVNITDDIALIITSKSITFNKRVQSINLYNGSLNGSEVCMATGWGRSSFNGPANITLKQLYTTTLSYNSCITAQPCKTPPINDITQICVFNNTGKGLCRGDSGGPLTYDKQLVGIVSWGRNCAAGYPDIFTRVYGYFDWIGSIGI